MFLVQSLCGLQLFITEQPSPAQVAYGSALGVIYDENLTFSHIPSISKSCLHVTRYLRHIRVISDINTLPVLLLPSLLLLKVHVTSDINTLPVLLLPSLLLLKVHVTSDINTLPGLLLPSLLLLKVHVTSDINTMPVLLLPPLLILNLN